MKNLNLRFKLTPLILSILFIVTMVVIQPIYNTKIFKDKIAVSNINELKDVFLSNAKALNTSFTVKYTGEKFDVKDTINNLFNYLFKKNTYVFRQVTNCEFSHVIHPNHKLIEFNLEYLIKKCEIDYYNSRVDQILKEIIGPDMCSMDKVKAVNDYIILNTSFDDNTMGSEYSPITILKEGKGVCQAYSLLAYKMLNALGFDVYYIRGFTTDNHGWNLVKVDSEWYHLDITWNASSNSGDISYDYFLVTDDIISKSHTWERNYYPEANCNKFSHCQRIPTILSNR